MRPGEFASLICVFVHLHSFYCFFSTLLHILYYFSGTISSCSASFALPFLISDFQQSLPTTLSPSKSRVELVLCSWLRSKVNGVGLRPLCRTLWYFKSNASPPGDGRLVLPDICLRREVEGFGSEPGVEQGSGKVPWQIPWGYYAKQ